MHRAESFGNPGANCCNLGAGDLLDACAGARSGGNMPTTVAPCRRAPELAWFSRPSWSVGCRTDGALTDGQITAMELESIHACNVQSRRSERSGGCGVLKI